MSCKTIIWKCRYDIKYKIIKVKIWGNYLMTIFRKYWFLSASIQFSIHIINYCLYHFFLILSLYLSLKLLRFGKINETNIFVGTNIPPPGVPSSKVNSLAMSITQTLDDFCDELIELIMPKSFLSLADGRLRVQSEINIWNNKN